MEKIIKDFIEKITIEVQKEENLQKIEFDILNPILLRYTNKIYPYITLLMYLYSLNLVLIVIILILIIMFNWKK